MAIQIIPMACLLSKGGVYTRERFSVEGNLLSEPAENWLKELMADSQNMKATRNSGLFCCNFVLSCVILPL